MSTSISTPEFTIPRTVLARLGVEEYLIHFWWLVTAIPAYGVWAVFFSNIGSIQFSGMVALAWPLTVPARSVLATSKAGRFFAKGATLVIDGKTLLFVPERGDGFRLAVDSVRQVVRRHGYFILRMKRMGFVAVPEAAFTTEAEVQEFLSAFNQP